MLFTALHFKQYVSCMFFTPLILREIGVTVKVIYFTAYLVILFYESESRGVILLNEPEAFAACCNKLMK